MSRKDDPDLAPDAALAVEHTEEREAEQWAYLGGEKDDIDDFDASDLDDGSNFDPNAAPEAQSGDEEAEDEKDDDEPAVEAEESDSGDVAEEGEEETVDADPEADEAEAEEEASPAPKGIPKHRFDEVNERRKAAEQELERVKAELEASKPPAEDTPPFDFDAAEIEYQDLLLDGDTDGALAKRKEIRAAEHAAWMAEAKTETKSELESDSELQELVSLSKEAEQMFDVFNPDHADYNQNILDKVMVFMRGYESTGTVSRPDAFVNALADVVDMYGLMPEQVEEVVAEAEQAAKPPPKKADPKTEQAKKDAHTPVAGQGTGAADAGVAAPSIEDMTDEELDALPAKTLARLRGDFI